MLKVKHLSRKIEKKTVGIFTKVARKSSSSVAF